MRALLRDLRTPRYAALTVLMAVVAAVCVTAGSWQIFRYDGKHLANDDLRRNDHAATATVGDVLPVLGHGAAPGADQVQYRTVTATGVFEPDRQEYVRRQQVDSTNGYLVLTPLRTSAATLLVVRGFLPADTDGRVPTDTGVVPTGEVTVRGRVQPSRAGDDGAVTVDGAVQVTAVDAASAARRLRTDVYAGWVELTAGSPATAGLTVVPPPDLSNPAGGAFELQHLAYIVQWYLFAGLALAAPVVMVRTDRRRAREDAEDDRPDVRGGAEVPGGADVRSAPRAPAPSSPQQRLADRYGR